MATNQVNFTSGYSSQFLRPHHDHHPVAALRTRARGCTVQPNIFWVPLSRLFPSNRFAGSSLCSADQ